MLLELAELSRQSILNVSKASIAGPWTSQMDQADKLIGRIIESFAACHVKIAGACMLVANILTPWQRLMVSVASYPYFPRYAVILGTLFQPVVLR